jgi:hypothetical protein
MRLSLLWVLRIAAGLVGLLHTAIAIQDQSMNEDGISYLDLGDAYLAGDWHPINSVWSPLYPLMLGTVLRLVRPSLQWEFTVVHLVNFGIFLLALICFEFFWRETRRALEAEVMSDPGKIILPEWAWWVFGYALFVWSSVVLIRLRTVSPDMLIAGIVYLAAGLLVRIGSLGSRAATHATFGGLLGLGYLTKAVMFPIGLIFLGAAAALEWKRGRIFRHWLSGAVIFAVIAGPLVLALSLEKGRVTFGEVGRLTYLRYVNGMPYPHWPAAAPRDLKPPFHPARRIHDDPPVYEFRSPVRGTYPLSYDPSYWYDGVSGRFNPGGQARRLAVSAKFYFDLFARNQGAMLGVVVLLLAMSPGTRRRGSWLGWPFALLGMGTAALVLYLPVYVEGRYLAPFVVLLWGGLLALVRVEDLPITRRSLRAAGLILPLLVVLQIVAYGWRYVPRMGPALMGAPSPRATPRQLAETLLRAGVRPGDEIGFIGYAFDAGFARLARVRITSELPSGQSHRFWMAPAETQEKVLSRFAQAGAVALVTDELPPGPVPEGWTSVKRRPGFGYLLLRRTVTGTSVGAK